MAAIKPNEVYTVTFPEELKNVTEAQKLQVMEIYFCLLLFLGIIDSCNVDIPARTPPGRVNDRDVQ